MIKTILADLDGTLADMCDVHFDAFNKALNEVCGFTLSYDSHLTYYNGLPTRVKIEKLRPYHAITREQGEAIQEYKQRFTISAIQESVKENKELQETITKLKDLGVKMGCVTNSVRDTTMLVLSSLGILSLMDLVVTNESVKINKPSPQCYIEAMSLLNTNRQETLIIEDSEVGLESANLSGAYVMAVKNPSEFTYDNIYKVISSIQQGS